jgi:hypothetical protein
MPALPPGPIFARSDARALGWSDSALSRSLRAGRLVAVRRGQLMAVAVAVAVAEPGLAYSSYDARDHSLIVAARAAARSRPGSVISHHSAALIHGLALLTGPGTEPTLTVAPRTADGLVGARVHRATLPVEDVTRVGADCVTSVARTVVDLARWLPRTAAVVAADSALHQHRTDARELEAVVLRCWNWPRISRAVRAIALTDLRSESPLESVSRLALAWLGLPTAQLQAAICGPGARTTARVDFYWDSVGVVGEADGVVKYRGPVDSLLAEKRRQERLEDLGLTVVRWGWDDVTRRPNELRSRLLAAFDRGRARDRAGFHRGWSVRPP